MADGIDRRVLRAFGRAIAGLVLTPAAQQAIGHKINAIAGGAPAGGPGHPAAWTKAAQDQLARSRPVAGHPAPPRAELIRNAMSIYRAKQTLLSDLDDETRAKLAVLAGSLLLKQPAGRAAAPASRAAPRRQERPLSPARAMLLQQALSARAAGKEAMLAGLDDEARAMLVAMAILTFVDPAAARGR